MGPHRSSVALALVASLTYLVAADTAAAGPAAAPSAAQVDADFRPAQVDGIKDSYLVVLKTKNPQDVDRVAADLPVGAGHPRRQGRCPGQLPLRHLR